MISIRKIGVMGRTYRHAKRYEEILNASLGQVHKAILKDTEEVVADSGLLERLRRKERRAHAAGS
jgi:hypothetical protein